jgi:hypothetical protein
VSRSHAFDGTLLTCRKLISALGLRLGQPFLLKKRVVKPMVLAQGAMHETALPAKISSTEEAVLRLSSIFFSKPTLSKKFPTN